ncbi:hypothetical protein RvY_12802-2 [Ramazzottius varieornatus]|uniref:Uncharacterized protein n=1 Tax=Ramazzottius varieornatus TaxID=947166 RepID=A0A1D1VKR9_RAMVA|nr:hypothetical protein RvY_12802-2 [Ramazzottius varieornatus]
MGSIDLSVCLARKKTRNQPMYNRKLLIGSMTDVFTLCENLEKLINLPKSSRTTAIELCCPLFVLPQQVYERVVLDEWTHNAGVSMSGTTTVENGELPSTGRRIHRRLFSPSRESCRSRASE